MRAKRRTVARHVGGTAGTFLDAAHAHDGHRRLGRDAGHFAEPVAVEHHVADDEDARLGGIVCGAYLGLPMA